MVEREPPEPSGWDAAVLVAALLVVLVLVAGPVAASWVWPAAP